jgi:hypothetical protein
MNQIDPVHIIPSYLSKIYFNIVLSLRSFIQGIRPDPRLLMNFRNKLIFLRWGVVSPTPNPTAGGPPLVGCPRLLIQYIHSYSSYLEAVSSICNLRTRHVVVKRAFRFHKDDEFSDQLSHYFIKKVSAPWRWMQRNSIYVRYRPGWVSCGIGDTCSEIWLSWIFRLRLKPCTCIPRT